MKALLAAFVALTVALTSVATAGSAGTKQRVQIDTKWPGHTVTLSALEAGAIENDSGTEGCVGKETNRTVNRDGQEAYISECAAWKFVGKRGTLTLRSRYTWIEAGGAYNIATGTWKVVRGTGQDARATGGGRSARVGTASIERVRYQGFLIAR